METGEITCSHNTWGHGSSLTFNVNDGYLEAIVRGYRSGILTTGDYSNLTQCETLEGICSLSN